MSDTTIARERVIAAALNVVAGRVSRETREPGAYDDVAQAELELDLLAESLARYVAIVAP